MNSTRQQDQGVVHTRLHHRRAVQGFIAAASIAGAATDVDIGHHALAFGQVFDIGSISRDRPEKLVAGDQWQAISAVVAVEDMRIDAADAGAGATDQRILRADLRHRHIADIKALRGDPDGGFHASRLFHGAQLGAVNGRRDGTDQHKAEDHLLLCGMNVEMEHRGADDGDDQRGNRGVQHVANATRQRRAANQNGYDGGQQEAVGNGWCAARHLDREQQARNRRQRPRNRKGEDFVACYVQGRGRRRRLARPYPFKARPKVVRVR